jgi:hypothetical protein
MRRSRTAGSRAMSSASDRARVALPPRSAGVRAQANRLGPPPACGWGMFVEHGRRFCAEGPDDGVPRDPSEPCE